MISWWLYLFPLPAFSSLSSSSWLPSVGNLSLLADDALHHPDLKVLKIKYDEILNCEKMLNTLYYAK